jgi:hypothetical protein
LITRDSRQSCALIIIADGFEEPEVIGWLSALRQAGLCIKSVGLTGGLIGGAHGIWLMPDLALADLEPLLNTTIINLIILPDGGQSLNRLEADPRIHKLLHRIAEQQGQIVTGPEGIKILQAAAVWSSEMKEINDASETSVLLRNWEKPFEIFAQDLIRRLK